MMIQEPLKKKGNLSIVQCKLCHADTKCNTKIVKLGCEYGVVCAECANTFTPTEMDLMYNMFIAFGGYFGMLKDSLPSTYKIITQMIKNYGLHGKDLKPTEIDVKILHKALLYGIAPRQLVQSISILSD
jgi:hypothetical protein